MTDPCDAGGEEHRSRGVGVGGERSLGHVLEKGSDRAVEKGAAEAIVGDTGGVEVREDGAGAGSKVVGG